MQLGQRVKHVATRSMEWQSTGETGKWLRGLQSTGQLDMKLSRWPFPHPHLCGGRASLLAEQARIDERKAASALDELRRCLLAISTNQASLDPTAHGNRRWDERGSLWKSFLRAQRMDEVSR